MSETYTAVYARDGEEWVAEIAGLPGLLSRAATAAEVRAQILDALASRVSAAPEDLHIVDQFAMPKQIQALQQEVKATRTDEQRAQMKASMSASKTAKEWAADLKESQRAPAAVKWLSSLEGELEVDEMCFAITVAEQMGRQLGGIDLEETADDAAEEASSTIEP